MGRMLQKMFVSKKICSAFRNENVVRNTATDTQVSIWELYDHRPNCSLCRKRGQAFHYHVSICAYSPWMNTMKHAMKYFCLLSQAMWHTGLEQIKIKQENCVCKGQIHNTVRKQIHFCRIVHSSKVHCI